MRTISTKCITNFCGTSPHHRRQLSAFKIRFSRSHRLLIYMHSPSIVLPLSLSLSLSLSLLRDNHLLNEIRKAGKNTRTCARPDFASLCVSRKNCITIRARSLSIRPAASRPPFPSRKRASQERDRREGEREREREVAGGPAASAVRHGEIIRGREDAWFTGDISM